MLVASHRKRSVYTAVSYQARLINQTHLRQWRFVEVQLQPHDHIWEISSMETHNVFGDPGGSITAVRQYAKSHLLISDQMCLLHITAAQ